MRQVNGNTLERAVLFSVGIKVGKTDGTLQFVLCTDTMSISEIENYHTQL